MNRTLVTGGSGFVGANLARRLLRKGHEVHLLLRPGYKSWRIQEIISDVVLHECDLGDHDAAMKLVGAVRPDWIFHLAAHGAYSWQTNVSEIMQTNFTNTVNLVSACLAVGFGAFVHTGSSSEYGFKDHAPAETEWLEPNSNYAVAKASATLFCGYTGKSQRVRITTLRLYSVYGPFEEPNRLIPQVILHGLKGQFPALVAPETARDYVYVDDVCDACIATAEKPHELGAVFNLGTGVQTSLKEVVEIARREMQIGTQPKWDSMPGRVWDTNVWVADNGRIRRELGWRPNHSFAEGFHRTVQWFRDNPACLNIYVKGGLAELRIEG